MDRTTWYEKLASIRRRERDVHDAMLEAPVEEAPTFFAAKHRLQAEWREMYDAGYDS